MEKKHSKLIWYTALNYDNAWVSFKVFDDACGPRLKITSKVNGILNFCTSIHTTKEGLKELANLFTIAANAEYGKNETAKELNEQFVNDCCIGSCCKEEYIDEEELEPIEPTQEQMDILRSMD